MCHGQVNKPLPAALVADLPVIKANLTDFQTYSQKLNIGKPYEEQTNRVAWGDTVDYIWWAIDLAIPMPLTPTQQSKLATLRAKIQQLKTYAIKTGMAAFHGAYHVCNHEEEVRTCEPEQEI